MKRLFLFLSFSLILAGKVCAAPDTTMNIAPSAVDQTVITSSDENTRNAEVSSKFNAHGHTDISQTGNSLAVGDGLDTDKTITANNADTNKPYIKFEKEKDRWVFSSEGGATGISVYGNSVYVHGNNAQLFITQPDGGCSTCGVDAAGTTFSCADVQCP